MSAVSYTQAQAKMLGDQPAYPSQAIIVGPDGCTRTLTSAGVSIREEFAKAAMQGMIANERLIQTCISTAQDSGLSPEKILADRSLKFADALLAALAAEADGPGGAKGGQ